MFSPRNELSHGLWDRPLSQISKTQDMKLIQPCPRAVIGMTRALPVRRDVASLSPSFFLPSLSFSPFREWRGWAVFVNGLGLKEGQRYREPAIRPKAMLYFDVPTLAVRSCRCPCSELVHCYCKGKKKTRSFPRYVHPPNSTLREAR